VNLRAAISVSAEDPMIDPSAAGIDPTSTDGVAAWTDGLDGKAVPFAHAGSGRARLADDSADEYWLG
jgi:hypothetical protein